MQRDCASGNVCVCVCVCVCAYMYKRAHLRARLVWIREVEVCHAARLSSSNVYAYMYMCVYIDWNMYARVYTCMHTMRLSVRKQ